MRTNSDINENEVMDMIMNNNNDYNQNCSSRTLKASKIKKNKFFNNGKPINLDDSDDDEYLAYYRKRSNSVDLYKKHKQEKLLKKLKEKNNNNDTNEINNNVDSTAINNINDDKAPDTTDNINKINEDNNNNNIKNGKKTKRVTFLMPLFVTIIDVESYKQFNAENTCKDPFEDIIRSGNSSSNNNTTSSSNKDKKLNDNERVVCSCFII